MCTYGPAIVVELLEGGWSEEELRDDEVRSRVHLRLQVQQVVFIRHGLGVSCAGASVVEPEP